MKKVLTSIIYAVLTAGLVYASTTLAAIPAVACTPTNCNAIDQGADALCEAQFRFRGCSSGIVVSCNAGGYDILCRAPNGDTCGSVSGMCEN